MKVLQLIDSLEAGGAERMAVNIANKLATKIETSHLCATRKEGLLRNELDSKVGYLFLNKKSTTDLASILKLSSYIRSNSIDLIHAHSTSFFLASLVRILNPKIKIVWHDHYGGSENLSSRPKRALQIMSIFFSSIISVNENLAQWARNHLRCQKVVYLKNFIYRATTNKDIIELGGTIGNRIVCVANFRPQKDHITLLKAFKLLNDEFPNFSLHLFGQINEDDCSEKIHQYIIDKEIQNIFIHGSVQNVSPYLEKCDIGVLSSISEGLPLALLEYGMAQLSVVCTNVGQCKEVVGDAGIIINPKDPYELYNGLKTYILNRMLSKADAIRFHKKIMAEYSEETFIPELLSIYG